MLSRYLAPLSSLWLMAQGCDGADDDQAPGTELRLFQREMDCGPDGWSTTYIGTGAVMYQAYWCDEDNGCITPELSAIVRDGVARVQGCSDEDDRLLMRYIRAVDVDAREVGAARVGARQ